MRFGKCFFGVRKAATLQLQTCREDKARAPELLKGAQVPFTIGPPEIMKGRCLFAGNELCQTMHSCQSEKLWHVTVAVGWLALEGLCRAWIVIEWLSLSLSDSPSLNEFFLCLLMEDT